MADSVNARQTEATEPIDAPAAPQVEAQPLPRSATIDSERIVGRILRMGALGSGTLFASSLVLGLIDGNATVDVAADVLRKSAGMILLVTPVARLIAGGTLLAIRGEWRYALYAGGILFLLAIALGTGAHV